jgi:hypothetical protein
MLKLTASREHHFIRNIGLELCKTVFLHRNNGVFKPSHPSTCIETCPWHVLRILIPPLQQLNAPRLRQCIKLAYCAPKKRVIEHPPPQLHFEAKLLSLDSDVTPLTSGNFKDQAAESEGSDWL